MSKPEVKVSLTIRGPKALRIRQLKEIIGLSTDADVIQHLIQRGMSAESSTFAAWDMTKQTQDALITQFAGMGEQMKVSFED